MSNNRKNNKCIFCNKRVKFLSSDGFMEDSSSLYHFLCVKDYGYQRFCKSVLSHPEKRFDLDKSVIIDTINDIIDEIINENIDENK